ncbi:phage tail assembly chaperone [Undibacterium sp. Di24W]|uniref:phage tail assembly chaperone n=1 Tax=Undibacterium sp. Di24W TaxID=3413033 RepID=UPI003BF4464B
MSTKNPKFVFGTAPETFKRNVEVIDIEGNVSEIEFTFKYRTKKQFAALLDEGVKAAKAEHAAADSESEKTGIDSISDQFYSELCEKNDKKSAEYVLKIAQGWDVANEFCVTSLLDLENRFPGALQSTAQTYAKAVSEVRTKNL